MRISQLWKLGATLLVLGAIAGASADEGAVPAPEAAEEVAPVPVPEEVPDEGAPGLEAAAEAAALPEEPAPDAEPVPLAEVPAAPAAEPTEEWLKGTGPQLGAVGYDALGRPGRIHVVIRGDTLWDVSDAYLGTPWVWPSIWQDNDLIENPHLIYPGDRIWITPWEMRKISAEEADALLAGRPAAPDPEPFVAPEPEPAPEPIQVVREEQPKIAISGRESVGLVTKDVFDASASIVASTTPRVMVSQEDRVWIGLGEGEVRPGDQFTAFEAKEKVYDPESGRLLGYHVNFLGWLEVLEPGAETSLAAVRMSASEMEIGTRLMPRLEPVSDVPLHPDPVEVEGRISYLPDHRTLSAMTDFVYLNRGTLDGVEVGVPLEVYREGFTAREQARGGERVRVPDRVIADLLVVRAQPDASVALVRHSAEVLELGDRFRTQGR